MDLSSLSQAFLASIDADLNIRQAAETHLKNCSSSPEIPFACLTLAVSFDSHPAVQQSAAVFLKNLILKHWKLTIPRIEARDSTKSSSSRPASGHSNTISIHSTSDSINLHQDQHTSAFGNSSPSSNSISSLINSPPNAQISNRSMQQPSSTPNNIPINSLQPTSTNSSAHYPIESSPFRDFSQIQISEFSQQVLYSFRLASPVVINSLTAILNIFLETSGIPKWPELLPITIKMLSDSEPNVVFSGVLVCLEIIRYMNGLPFQSNWAICLRAEVVSLLFPPLSKIAHSLSSETHSRAGLILWKILKCYKLATHYDFPHFLQQENQLKDWLGLFLHILSSPYYISDHTNTSSFNRNTNIDINGRSNHPNSDTTNTSSNSTPHNNTNHSHLPASSTSSHISQGFSSLEQVSSPGSSSGRPLDLASKSPISPWAKCKKWSCMILSHLMTAHTDQGNPIVLRSSKDNKEFSHVYIQYFAPNVCQLLIADIEKWKYDDMALNRTSNNTHTNNSNKQGNNHATDQNKKEILLCSPTSVLQSIIDFFQVAIKINALWALILPKMEIVMSKLIFGILKFTESDMETFYFDPEEYILMNIENSDFSIRGKTLKFISSLVELHRDDMFQGILVIINQCFTKYNENPQDIQSILEKDAAFQIMIELEDKVTSFDSPIHSQINTFIMEQVINRGGNQSMSSHNALLLSRSCEVIKKFENVNYSKPELEQVLSHIMYCFNGNSTVMVNYNAAFALRTLFTNSDYVCDILGPQISQIMQKMLELYEEVNSESLSSVMEDLIDRFTAQLAPFSTQLCSQLSAQFFRILNEISDRENRLGTESGNPEGDSEEFSFVDDRQMVAVGVLNALNTLLLALEKSPLHIAKLEPYLLHVFRMVIENANSTFYQEVFELVDTCLYTPRSVSNNMAQVIGMMRTGFKKDPSQCCEYFGPVLCNFLNFSFPSNEINSNNANATNIGASVWGLMGPVHSNYHYPPDLTDLSFELLYHFLREEDPVAKEKISSEDKQSVCILGQVLFLKSSNSGVVIDTGSNHKYLVNLLYQCLNELSRPMTSLVIYRSLIEVILAAIVYDAHTVLNFLAGTNYLNWFLDVIIARPDMFNRSYDSALAVIGLLSLSMACSERDDECRLIFPKVIKPILNLISSYSTQVEDQAQNPRPFSKSPISSSPFVSYDFSSPSGSLSFVQEQPQLQHSQSNQQLNQSQMTPTSSTAGQFAFVNESPQTNDPSSSAFESSVQESFFPEPVLDSLLEKTNIYQIYKRAIQYLTNSVQQDQYQSSGYSGIPSTLSSLQPGIALTATSGPSHSTERSIHGGAGKNSPNKTNGHDINNNNNNDNNINTNHLHLSSPISSSISSPSLLGISSSPSSISSHQHQQQQNLSSPLTNQYNGNGDEISGNTPKNNHVNTNTGAPGSVETRTPTRNGSIASPGSGTSIGSNTVVIGTGGTIDNINNLGVDVNHNNNNNNNNTDTNIHSNIDGSNANFLKFNGITSQNKYFNNNTLLELLQDPIVGPLHSSLMSF